MTRTLILPTLLLSFACSEDKEDPRELDSVDPVEEMSDFGGCGDFYVFASNEGDTIALEISGSELIRRTFDAGETMSFEFELEEENELEIVFLVGENITHESCTDAVISELEPSIEKSYLPVNGTLSITIEPTGEENEWGELPADATIQLQSSDFCVENHHEDCFNIQDLLFTTQVGWLPE